MAQSRRSLGSLSIQNILQRCNQFYTFSGNSFSQIYCFCTQFSPNVSSSPGRGCAPVPPACCSHCLVQPGSAQRALSCSNPCLQTNNWIDEYISGG